MKGILRLRGGWRDEVSINLTLNDAQALLRPVPASRPRAPARPGRRQGVERRRPWSAFCPRAALGLPESENRQGEVVFGAVVFPEHEAPREEDDESWLRRFYDREFEYGGDGRGRLYLFRYMRLDELVGLHDIGAQAEALADFVIEAWETLEHDPVSRP